MPKDRVDQVLDIVRQHIVASIHDGPGLSATEECQRAAWRRPDVDGTVIARAVDNLNNVSLDQVIHVHLSHCFLEIQRFFRGRDGFDGVYRVFKAGSIHDFYLGIDCRIAKRESEGKRRAAPPATGVPSCSSGSAWAMTWRAGGEGGLHRQPSPYLSSMAFQQRGLGFRGAAVDFIGKEDMSRTGPARNSQFSRALVVKVDANDIGGEKVGRELDTLKDARGRRRTLRARSSYRRRAHPQSENGHRPRRL